MQFDVKHFIALIVGFVLSFAASQFHIDLSKSCPAAPVAVTALPSPVVIK